MIHFTVTLTASTPCNLNRTQLLALTQQQGFGMLDIRNPQVPQQTAILFEWGDHRLRSQPIGRKQCS
jgi:hypothetical protein